MVAVGEVAAEDSVAEIDAEAAVGKAAGDGTAVGNCVVGKFAGGEAAVDEAG